MSMTRGRGRPLAWFWTVVAALVAGAVARRWVDAVEVRGGSMAPTLLPGDRLLVERWTFRGRAPRATEIVLAPDPREPRRELIKRVAAVRDGLVELRGDASETSTDSRSFGTLPVAQVRWRVVARYWPRRPIRLGRRPRPPRRSRRDPTEPG
jgi:nickel-type superoxide dismutase maturation protease